MRLTLRRNGSIRHRGRHVGWVLRHYLGHMLIGLAPYRDAQGRLGTTRRVFLAYPHDRFWPELVAWTGHLNEAELWAALEKLHERAERETSDYGTGGAALPPALARPPTAAVSP